MTNTGSDNYGGPIVTAGGVLFIGATSFDRKFHAYDKATGSLLWETTLPAAGSATPSTYTIDGRQFDGRIKNYFGASYVNDWRDDIAASNPVPSITIGERIKYDWRSVAELAP